MGMRTRITLPLLALSGLVTPAGAEGLDLELYARLLETRTRPVEDVASTRVDYAALRNDPDWRRLVADLDTARPDTLDGAEQLAFWINTYNILAIQVVLDHYPLDSIRDAGSFLSPVWKADAGRVGGQIVTLHQIEHAILRPLGDPRIHGAIVCASLSCPPLRREPYRAATLDAQLDDNMRHWLQDPRKGVRYDDEGNVHLSKIFDWFEEDFEEQGGVLAFVARYGPPRTRSGRAARSDSPSIRYLDYDWSLNDAASAP